MKYFIKTPIIEKIAMQIKHTINNLTTFGNFSIIKYLHHKNKGRRSIPR